MAWSGGGVSFTGSVPSSTYGVTYATPVYSSPPAGYSVSAGPYIKTSSGSSVSCTATASVTWEVELTRTSPYSVIYQTTSFSNTAPACPVVPPDTSGRMNVYNGSSWVKGPVAVFNGSGWVTGTVYVYNGSTWVKSV